MMEGYYRILEAIATGSDSSLVFALIILAALVLPLYGLLLRDRTATRKHEANLKAKQHEREDVILAVVKDNTAAITECTTVLSGTRQAIDRIHDRLDGALAAR